jgi:hypothetical protein
LAVEHHPKNQMIVTLQAQVIPLTRQTLVELLEQQGDQQS